MNNSTYDERFLYKFRSAPPTSKQKRRNIDNQLYCAKFYELNDPLEGCFFHHQDQCINLFYQKIEKRICSLTDLDGFKSILMWSHYASNMNGYVFEFIPKLSDDKFNPDIIDRIHYLTRDAFEKKLTYKPEDSPDEFIINLFFSKTDEWSYENEWRILTTKKYLRMKNVSVYFFKRYFHLLNEKQIKLNKDVASMYDKIEKTKNLVKSKLCDSDISFYEISYDDLEKLNNLSNRDKYYTPVYQILNLSS